MRRPGRRTASGRRRLSAGSGRNRACSSHPADPFPGIGRRDLGIGTGKDAQPQPGDPGLDQPAERVEVRIGDQAGIDRHRGGAGIGEQVS